MTLLFNFIENDPAHGRPQEIYQGGA